MVRFLTIREGIIYYTVEEMVELVEKGIRELGELVLREAEGAGTEDEPASAAVVARPHNLTLLGREERYEAVNAVVPPRWCFAEPEELKLNDDE